MKRFDVIDGKADQIREMIRDQENHVRVLATVGSADAGMDAKEKLAFQQRRLAAILWAKDQSEAQIQQRINALEASLGIAQFSKYGNVSGFPKEIIDAICEIELLELALGTHPALQETVQ